MTASSGPAQQAGAPGRSPGGIRIAGTGASLPQHVLTNHDLMRLVETSDEWITQRTGIKERRIADDSTALRHLCRDAVQLALQNAQLQPTDLDLLILATLTPEMCCPSTAARVVADLGATPAGAVDVSAACSGFVYGMNMAAGLLLSGCYRNIAVVGAEILSRITNWEDRGTCILFGDGAGAAILSTCDDPQRGCLYQSMASDGSAWKELYVPRTQRDLPADGNGFTGKYNTLQMNGREVYKFAVSTLEKTIDQALNAAGIKASDLAMIVPHQSNKRILESARERLGLPQDKLYINIDRFGNTSAASVPICLHELVEQGRIKAGDLVLFVALGGGLTWTSSLWRV